MNYFQLIFLSKNQIFRIKMQLKIDKICLFFIGFVFNVAI
ncbi:hypothetical protein THERMOT_908 [Bathymodiolus thermophilus thioautotrophic gill symbiont]|uniref:Uncharacterized protein n=1 Tax=Bathymodiolus thermophilus thioautotrophic gill symbiont TaxID=2360 RepID=A0A8H8XD58_9GAMM|nr:hypothetical protein THERMOT_908 [Bathymodiolus thermophilus thioautotrophic gill symbiont]CAB5499015.1 hypothetical protein THERMOS_952 [Bathymodiolus thermophilus thioautotrophic gill symbiont]